MKKCGGCNQEKEDTEFNWRNKLLGIRHPVCRDCQHGHQKTWYQDHQEQEKERVRRRRTKLREEARGYIFKYKSTHPCSRCGETDPVVLDFHHIRGKGSNIGKPITDAASLTRIKIEISLCIVLCSNCHRKITHKERKQW